MSDEPVPLERPATAPGAGASGDVAVLDTAIWRQLGEGGNAAQFRRAWLSLQCQMIGDVTAGLLLVPAAAGGALEPAAVWPDKYRPDPALVALAERAAADGRGMAQEARVGGGSAALAYPVSLDGALIAVVALDLGRSEARHMRSAMRQVQWGTAALRDRERADREFITSRTGTRSKLALDLLATALEQERFKPACMAVATELAVRAPALRVSIGFVRRGSVRIAAISHTASFGQSMNLARHVENAMDEAMDQRSVVQYPPVPGQPLATRAAEELALLQRGHVLTIPLLVRDRFVGAVSLERPEDMPFEPETVGLLDAVCAALAPVLEDRRQSDRWIGFKVADALWREAKTFLGPSHTGRKLAALGAIAVIAFFALYEQEYRVNAQSRIEGSVRRAVVASYDGFIKQADVRAGSTVRAGDLIAALEDRDLTLERLKWVTERQQRLYEYDRALAARQPAVINVVKSQIEQADAQIGLIDEQIARAQLRAPFDGLVVSGDLSQSVGASVSRGQVLFEIAPLDAYRVIMNVDERDLADVQTGQAGQLVVSSLPDQAFALNVETITPVAEAGGGRTVFRVEGRLTENSPRLRPGMEGVAKIDAGERLLIWIWTRSMTDWLRLKAWQWLP
ncbi:HlyD family efflux transporter periplasmic adaptor subunit [Terrihabitans rhizophilus]|uniref:HlyD family efflux transporter periplasmic adaptor subunit n=1 Tax=Terrihabitans rhizophilus TaxID=3092662 RepID=A0ABU4RLV7_9HYPH|nr:HlyD family efflux transporter periplasmic adaptor subunit [Terrihabitans sp. PJ23]MDX6805807.1 HlyD family efflux transporter periplasmic adaptor subunit [Terrihabitans sp. PJ23]